jgi:Ca-activated chloride channel family protein
MVTIVAAGSADDAYGDYLRVGNAESGTIDAPAEAGEYEVRYLLEEDGRAIASAPVTITAPETSVSAPETAVAGSRISVSWTNVIHPRDKVAVVPADAPADADDEYLRTGNATSGTLDTAAAPGDYEVRYVLNIGDRAIASTPIRLTAPEVEISAPETASAGSRLEVSWNATVHHRDKITIVAADAPAGEDGDYNRVGGGTSSTVDVPDTPGDYEVRYLLNASGQAIARKSIRVE